MIENQILKLVSDVAELKIQIKIILYVGGATVIPAWISVIKEFWKIK